VCAAPRIDERLLREVARLDDGVVGIAELCRLAGEAAERLGVPRPSYEGLRPHVHALRRSARGTSIDLDLRLAVRGRGRRPRGGRASISATIAAQRPVTVTLGLRALSKPGFSPTLTSATRRRLLPRSAGNRNETRPRASTRRRSSLAQRLRAGS
jgi:hypothetical protein